LYESNPDPWGFTDDPYERAKYQHSIEALGNPNRFLAGLEVGCSIGVLTHLLGPRCETLLGVDLLDQPLRLAAERCADQPWVSFRRMQVPDEWPNQRFDLIVLSEVLYFLSPEDIDRLVHRVTSSLLPGARVLLVNWLGESDDPMTGDAAAERFITTGASDLTVTEQARRPRYRLDLLIGR
jgi:cyclopropane fatty-acyl-phospholipid synthase-like methyltransferase